MRANFLKLNDLKTEAIFFGSKSQISKVALPPVQVGDALVQPAHQVRNLGSIFDSELSMVPHVNGLCQTACFHIRNIGKIRKFLDTASCEQLIHAFVTSRLDLYNSLLIGLPRVVISKLQRVQNIAARVITRTAKTHHITPLLELLHWLPVQQRIHFKVLVQVYRALHDLAPGYLVELLEPYRPPRALRSADSQLLCVPRSRTVYGDRAFSKAGPVLWNALPLDCRMAPSLPTFKSRLKTYLFRTAYHYPT